MSKILIAGNGFDLFHGLPTKYGHFMAVMKTIESNNFVNDDISFNDLFGKDFKNNFSSDYDLILEKFDTKNIKFNNILIEKIKSKLNKNGWYKYFKGVLEIETWIDFESELENALMGISIIFNNVKNIPTNNFSFYDKYILRVFCDFEHFEFSDITSRESSSFYFNEKFLDYKNSRIKEELVLKSMHDSLQSFTAIFNRYLVDIVDLFYDEFTIKNKIPFNQINKIFTSNYTPTLEKIYSVDKSKIIYFHGKVNEIDEAQNLIFGISELAEKIKENKMYNFSKQFQKIFNNINYKFIEIPNIKDYLEETIFYVIGHSLDKSDKDYVLDLFKFLEADSSKKSKICVFYYNKKDMENKLKNLFNVVGEQKISEMNKNERLYFTELNDANIVLEFNRKLKERKTISISVIN